MVFLEVDNAFVVVRFCLQDYGDLRGEVFGVNPVINMLLSS